MHAKSNRQVALRSHLQFISLRLASPPSLLPQSPSVCTRVFILPDFLYFAGFCFGLVWFLSSANRIDAPASAPPPDYTLYPFAAESYCTLAQLKKPVRETERERANPCEMLWRVCEVSSSPSPRVAVCVCANFCVCPSNCLPLFARRVCVFAVWVGQCEWRRVESSRLFAFATQVRVIKRVSFSDFPIKFICCL